TPPRIRPSGWQTRNRSSRLIVIAAGPTWTGNVTVEMIEALRTAGAFDEPAVGADDEAGYRRCQLPVSELLGAGMSVAGVVPSTGMTTAFALEVPLLSNPMRKWSSGDQ